MYAALILSSFSATVVTKTLIILTYSQLLKQFVRLAYCVCQQGCIMGISEVQNGLSAYFVLQIFIVPTSFNFRTCYVIAKQIVIRRVINTGKQRRRWEDNIKMDLQEVGRGCGDWMELAQDRDRWRALVSTVMNFGVA